MAIVSTVGCGGDGAYLLSLVQGALTSYGTERPIDDVIADGSVTPEQAGKLRLVQVMRAYAEQRVGETVGTAYSTYQDNGDAPAGYALLASPPDQFELHQFEIPLFGFSDTKPFFDRDMADAEADGLRAQGYDVFLGEIEGFSTIGVLSDPVRASNLKQDEGGLAEVIFHELLHNTIFKPGDANFNESMATFVGRTAGRRFFVDTFGADSPLTQKAVRRFDDEAKVDALVLRTFSQLSNLYAQSISREAKLALRQAVFAAARDEYNSVIRPTLADPSLFTRIDKFEANNATMLVAVRYTGGLDLYQAVYEAVGQDFPMLLDVLRQAAAQSDSRGFLEEWLGQHGAAGP